MVIDPFGRAISYVRVSVTDRCDFRCVYCMAEDMTFLPKADLLTLEELDRLCARVRRPGRAQDPADRRRAAGAAQHHVAGRAGSAGTCAAGALDELTLTTNGSQLARFAGELYDGRRAPGQRLARQLGARAVRGDHPLGQVRPGDGRDRGR